MSRLVKQATRDEIKACLLSGLSYNQTARQCGVSIGLVSREQRKHNLPKTHMAPERCSASTIKKFQKLLDQGKPQVHVAAACNSAMPNYNRLHSLRWTAFPKQKQLASAS
ncbi:hypothetical protein BC940DRAFT_308444 [Gongronella butleri]|nr:hypothetical protein BC940DRAFT_308444 [Gongronella butleri]